MDVEKICDILKKEFMWVFCDTCKHEARQDCVECSKKKLQEIEWELSDDAAVEIALMIREELDKQEDDTEWVHSMMKQLP